MTRHAFVVGGTGQVGRAVARRLASSGWSVTVASRGRYPNAVESQDAVRTVTLDRTQPGALSDARPADVDVLIDLIAYNAGDAHQLLEVADRVGSLIVLSTLGVYADAAGRNLQTASDGVTGLPEFPAAISENQPTVSADDATFAYAAGKVALEQTLLDGSRVPVTVIRPGAIHGTGTIYAREWWLVKRVLDARPVVLLAHSQNVFHSSATTNLADLIAVAAERPGTRILNSGDPHPPTALEITQIVLRVLGSDLPVLRLPGAPPGPGVGNHPWPAAIAG